jgi:hypothetical protein
MHTLLLFLFILGAIPAVLGIVVLVAVEPKPVSWEDHVRGICRYLILGGVGFHLARVAGGGALRWEIVALVLGIGLAVALHARQNHLLAKLQEKLEDGQESGA